MKYDWQSQRRLRAYGLLQKGWNQYQVAVTLGVTQSSVSRWLKKVVEEGTEALVSKQRRAPVGRLNWEARQELHTLLALGARQLGYEETFWTRQRVAELIGLRFGVSLSPRQVGRILLKMGYRLRGKELNQLDTGAL